MIRDVDWGISGNIYADTHAPAGIYNILYTAMKIRSRRGNYLVGSRDIPVRRVTFRDVDFTITGNLDKAPSAAPDPLPIFQLPDIAHAFLLRHAKDVRFLNTRIVWDGASGPWRSGLHVVDGQNVDYRDLSVDPFGKGWDLGITEERGGVR